MFAAITTVRFGVSASKPTTVPRTIGKLPKKPVVWIGAVWLQMPDGELDTRSWRSNGPINTGQARQVLAQLLEQLIGEHGKDAATWSGFYCQSR